MAEGLLQPENSAQQMEDLGDEYFQELQSRSFFQQSSNISSRYVMHDLINDLAQLVAGEIFFFRMDVIQRTLIGEIIFPKIFAIFLMLVVDTTELKSLRPFMVLMTSAI
ncbi:hypothetical protein ACOSQ4_003876 [Xanthoceras sorbifolium]